MLTLVVSLLLLLLESSLGSLPAPAPSSVTQIGEANLNDTLFSNEVVFLNFYADWCPFSARLAPIFEQAGNLLKMQYPEPGKVLLGRVDCFKETLLAQIYDIRKLPTLRLFYRGQPLRREFRGKRSKEALVDYVKLQFRPPIVEFDSNQELAIIDPKRRSIIAYFEYSSDPVIDIFNRLADRFKNDCDFYKHVGLMWDGDPTARPEVLPALIFRPDVARTHGQDERFEGNHLDNDELYSWMLQHCVPLVREIDFHSVEEIIEQGLPLLLLFHQPDDLLSVKDFKSIVQMQLADMRGKFSFATVDGMQFVHSVHHMGKTTKDLPLIAIDSLQFMFPFPQFSDLYIPGKLRRFIDNFLSRYLDQQLKKTEAPAPNKDSAPAKSTFKELGPSKHRYSLLHDEL
nr:endoplasmic reticulum resident protein 44-like [Drosophila kikkawai]